MVGKEKPWNWKVSKLRKYRNLYLSQCWNSFRHVANAKKNRNNQNLDYINVRFVGSKHNNNTIHGYSNGILWFVIWMWRSCSLTKDENWTMFVFEQEKSYFLQLFVNILTYESWTFHTCFISYKFTCSMNKRQFY